VTRLPGRVQRRLRGPGSLLISSLCLGCAESALERASGEAGVRDAGASEACVPGHVSEAPALTGPHCVGLERLVLIDAARSDPFATNERPRSVSLTLHYPIAAGSAAEPAPYGDLEIWGVVYGGALPQGMHSQAVLDEAVAEPADADADGFPLLLYSPGFARGLAETNTFMAQELASHGYVVAMVDHPYVSLAVRDGDGSIVRFGDGREALAMPDDIAGSEDAVYAFPVVVDDLRFVLDELARRTRDHPRWRGRIDLARVGAFGHSYGGAAAAELLRSDPRVKAAIDYDGRFHRDVLERGVGGPLLLMAIDGRITGEPPPNENYGYRAALRTAEPGYYVEIEGAIHTMFQADIGVLWKRKRGTSDPRWSGDMDADSTLALCTAYSRAFFDAYLKDGATDALERVSGAFAGVRFGVAR
jgi:predicted dienelactone hydrolase